MRIRLQRFERLDSTSEEAFRRLAAGAARHGDAYCAREQTAGRGRRGRTWHTEPGSSLALSVVLAPERPLVAVGATVAGGLAVLDAVRSLGVEQAHLDWPNDVEVAGAKLAGVLVEARGLDPDAPRTVLGIGLNVAQREFPSWLREEREVTSLALCGLELSVDDALDALLPALSQRLDQALGGDPALASDFAAALGLAPGAPIAVRRVGGEVLEGRFLAFDLQDGVRLECEGAEQTVRPEWIEALEPR